MSSFAWRSIMLKKMENSERASTQPCLTPLEIGKLSDREPLCFTWPLWPSWSWRMMVRNFGGQPSREGIFHRPSLLTVSNALVRSMKTTKRPMFCSLHFSWICRSTKIMSVVPLFARKPHWLSGVKSSMMEGMSLFRRMRASTLPAMDRSVMPR